MWRHYAMTMVIAVTLVACQREQAAYLQPSGVVIESPEPDIPFADYLSDTRERLRSALAAYYQNEEAPFGAAYPLQTVLEMRAPFELQPAPECTFDPPGDESRQGYLLIHGLSDSPYLLSAIGRRLHEQNPCALIRALLLPGHGTVPADAGEVSREHWREAVRYGIAQFRPEVDQLTLVGYSAGATLALEYADQHPDDTLIDGLVLLSPALALPGVLVRLSPYLRWVRQWVGIESEQDAAKYESFPIHAGAEFFLMIKEFQWRQMAPLQVPVFMAASSHDATVDARASIELFCSKGPEGQRELFWITTETAVASADDVIAGQPLPSDCAGVRIASGNRAEYRSVSGSHVGITMPPDDPHYGVDGLYRQCLHYPAGELRDQCLEQNEQTVYGERTLLVDGRFDGRLMRRNTFNPAFEEMVAAMHCLLESECTQ